MNVCTILTYRCTYICECVHALIYFMAKRHRIRHFIARATIFVILWLTFLWQHKFICAMLYWSSILSLHTCLDNYVCQLNRLDLWMGKSIDNERTTNWHEGKFTNISPILKKVSVCVSKYNIFANDFNITMEKIENNVCTSKKLISAL